MVIYSTTLFFKNINMTIQWLDTSYLWLTYNPGHQTVIIKPKSKQNRKLNSNQPIIEC